MNGVRRDPAKSVNALGLLFLQICFVFLVFVLVFLRLFVGRRLILSRDLFIRKGRREKFQHIVIVGKTASLGSDTEITGLGQLNTVHTGTEFKGVVILRDAVVQIDL